MQIAAQRARISAGRARLEAEDTTATIWALSPFAGVAAFPEHGTTPDALRPRWAQAPVCTPSPAAGQGAFGMSGAHQDVPMSTPP